MATAQLIAERSVQLTLSQEEARELSAYLQHDGYSRETATYRYRRQHPALYSINEALLLAE